MSGGFFSYSDISGIHAENSFMQHADLFQNIGNGIVKQPSISLDFSGCSSGFLKELCKDTFGYVPESCSKNDLAKYLASHSS